MSRDEHVEALAEHKRRLAEKIAHCLDVLDRVESMPAEQKQACMDRAGYFLDRVERKKTCRDSLVSFWRAAMSDLDLARAGLRDGVLWNGYRYAPGELQSSFPFLDAFLLEFSQGKISKERAIQSMGLRDYAELLQALGRDGLSLPVLPENDIKRMAHDFVRTFKGIDEEANDGSEWKPGL